LAETEDLLHQLEIRATGNASKAGAEGAEHAGSPFLEGPTVTVAGAALLQRVAGAVVKAGGNIQSSQVDVGKAQTKEGMIDLLISCEMEQSSLQKLLYDIEAGMPFLFVDQLDVQVAQATANKAGAERIRVMIGVSGQWQGSK
jgi:general secretion pathway protein M